MILRLKRFLPLLLIIALLTFAVVAIAGGKTPISDAVIGQISDKKLVTCTVTVVNVFKLPSTVKTIRSFDCQEGSSCTSAFSISALGIIPKDTFFVQAKSATGTDKGPSVQFDVTLDLLTDTSVTKEVSVCTAEKAGILTLKNGDGEILETKQWQVT